MYRRSKLRLSERLGGIWGWVVPHILKHHRKALLKDAQIMYVGAKPYAILWSRSPVMLQKGVVLPYYMLDPHKTCDSSWMYTQNVMCRYDNWHGGSPAQAIRPAQLPVARASASVSGESNIDGCGKMMNLRKYYTGMTPPAEAVRTHHVDASVWNPEYDNITPGRTPWDTAREHGWLWPTAQSLFEACLSHHASSRDAIGTIGGNYGLNAGYSSCRTVTYVHSLLEKGGWRFDKPHYATHSGVRTYYSSVPWIYHSPQHCMNPVGLVMFARKPITWRPVNESVSNN